MNDEPKLAWRRRRGWLALLLGVVAFGGAVAIMLRRSPASLGPVTLTAGSLDTTRALIARRLVDALASRGLEGHLVGTSSTEESLAGVDRGAIDLALVSGVYRTERFPHVRAVTPLYIEALHLLVKVELVDEVSRSLDALRGHTVDLGPSGSTTAGLATAVLDFAGVAASDATTGDGYVARSLKVGELESLTEQGDRTVLPDAVLHLATVPSKIALRLIRSGGYRLVALPFAEAFRLAVLLTDGPTHSAAGVIERRQVSETVIPAFTYELDPPIPAVALPTIGARLTLVANDRVPPEAVERVLDAVFSAEVAQITSPPLDRTVLALPSRTELHPGALDYLRRDKPYITDDTVNALSNSLSILGALAGGGLFLWQWLRQRARALRDETFGSYMLRIADVERRTAALELAATLELEPLAELQRELLELKGDALERFAAGDLGDQAALSDLLMPLNAARDHIGNLILHVRDNLEEKAEGEGRTAKALWTEAIAKPDHSDG